MAKQTSILRYLPNVIKSTREFVEIDKTEVQELNELWLSIDKLSDDQFVSIAHERGIGRWESMLGITPKGTETLDVRRFRVLARINEQPPYTFRALESQLTNLCGQARYTLAVENVTFKIIVKVALTAKGKFDEVISLVNRMSPANMTLNFSLLYNQHLTLENFAHTQLGLYTYQQLRDEVIT
ncbi:MAG: putative phage tail protein [Alkaliphilus sp.]